MDGPAPEHVVHRTSRLAPLLIGLIVLGAIALSRADTSATQASATSSLLPTVPAPQAPIAEPEPQRSQLSTFTPPREAIQHVLVAPTAGGYLLLDPDRGTLEHVPLETAARSLAPAGGGGAMFVHFDDDVLGVVTVGASDGRVISPRVRTVLPGPDGRRLWVSSIDQPERYRLVDLMGNSTDEVEPRRPPRLDPRYRSEAGGGTYRVDGEIERLGPHHLVATGTNVIVGRTCNERARCVLEWFDGEEWRRLLRVLFPMDDTQAIIDPTERWVVSIAPSGPLVQVYDFENGARLSVSWTGADPTIHANFTSTGSHLLVMNTDRLRIFDLQTMAESSTDLPVGLTGPDLVWTLVPTPPDLGRN